MKYGLLFFWIGFAVHGCASIALDIPYPYYMPESPSYSGKLIAIKEANDTDFKRCAPDANEKGKCVVMFTRDFYALKADYLQTRRELNDCQQK